MSKFIIFDGNAILHRAFHALPPLTTTSREPINAVYGMISMLFKVITDFEPTHLAFAFDTKEPTFRNELSAEYQAQRVEVLPELISQFDKARDTVKAFHIPFFEKSGFEADDVIGTIANKVSSVEEVIVVTGDRDMLQLITSNVKLYMPVGGFSNGKLYGREETKEKMGVYPEEIVDYKALVGDASDNYKGVAGIGPKTAINLLEKFGNLENIYKNIEEVPAKLKEKLTVGNDSALLSQNLARIRTDVPINFTLEVCGEWSVDNEDVMTLFSEYGFKTLTKRAQEVGAKIEAKKQLSLL